ncbi:fasciclin domain-containing protein [Phocaeicola plebeius]|uniref:fasciclin domain-containing protein n=1 Tax=Phocaeicola plebeius TaxID=310297 RepID=UPI00307A7DF5
MKALCYYLLGIFSLCILNACDNEENPTPEPPPSKGQEEVQKIVEVLKESNLEVSQFVEILEKVNVADLTQDELTVFAVKNTSTASRATALDTASIKNHIAKGRYAKDDLKDGTKLTSISNETLYVTRTGNDVLINGINIIGDAIQAGNSYVYIVPKIIPVGEKPVTTYKHQTTIKVNLIDGGYKPLDGVSIAVKNENTGAELGTFTTDATGTAVISHNCDTLTYTISKEGYSDLSDGFLLAGMENNGNLSYADLNGDGRIDEGDKVSSEPYIYYLNYKERPESILTETCYMIAVNETETALTEWNNALKDYNNELLNMEMQLITGYGGSPYESDESMKYLANIYYTSAFNTLETGEKLLNGLAENSTVKQTIQLGVYRIKVDLYAYFGTMFKSGSNFISADESKDQLISNLKQYKETCPNELKNETSFLLAKVHMLAGEYIDAYDNIRSVIPNGYVDIESKLILAISAKDSNLQESIEALNFVRESFEWLEPIQSLDGNELIETCHTGLNESGNLYPYYRVLNEAINYIQVLTGFTMPKHHLLPIPQSVIDESNEVIKQNNGYN